MPTTWVETVAAENVDLESIVDNYNTIKITNVNDGDDQKKAAHFINSSTHANARGLKVEGITELDGDVMVEGNIAGIGGSNIEFLDITLFDALVNMKDDITCEEDIIVDGNSRLKGAVNIGLTTAAGTLDAGGAQDLKIGSVAAKTADVVIGRAGQDVEIVDDLKVGGNASIDGTLTVGPGNAAAEIDAIGNENLEIGGNATTTDVVIGRAGQGVTIANKLDVDGTLTVGPGNADGLIDSGGSVPTPQDLKIGSSTVTTKLELSRSGQVTEMQGNLLLNGKELIMTNSLTLGSGFVHDAVGHGAGESIDVYIGGNRVGYWDQNGWN